MWHEVQIGFGHKTLLLDGFLEVNQKNQIFSKCGTSWLALKIASKIWKIREKDFKTV